MPRTITASPKGQPLASDSQKPFRADREEVALIADARQGDHRAFAQLLKNNDYNMRGLAFSLLGTAGSMDDALQDAYLKAFKNLNSFRGQAAFSTWLYRIVYRTCLDHLRSQGRKREVSLQLVADRPDPGAGVDQQVAGADQMQRALSSLSVDHRAAVLLVDGEGLSYDEASLVLDVEVGTVASRLNRARHALRNAILESDTEHEDRS